jgi:hypothetical protein
MRGGHYEGSSLIMTTFLIMRGIMTGHTDSVQWSDLICFWQNL